ncbi:MAG: chemotaxis protein CheA [Acidobacteria bacterium]|nr:chemotaxis protein CheA [Acidobacteriota bacterium]
MPVRKRKTKKRAETKSLPVSLDDVVSLLIQIEPDDKKKFQQLSEGITALSNDSSLDPQIISLAMEAKDRIDRYISGEIHDAEDVLVEASMLLEQAANVRDTAIYPVGNIEVKNQKNAGKEKGSTEDSPVEETKVETAPDILSPPENNRVIAESEASEEAAIQTSLPADADHELIAEFIMESRELLESSETALLELENNPEDFEAVNTVFRAFHTVKGTSGFLGLEIVSKMAHLAESLLSRIRNKEIRLLGGYADLALKSLDMLKKVVAIVEEALRGESLVIPEGYEELMGVLTDPDAVGISEETAETLEDSVDLTESEEVDIVWEPQQDEHASSTGSREANPPVQKKKTVSKRDAEYESSIRVNTARLDRLIDMVGELVIAQSMVSQDKRLLEENSHELLRKVTHAGKIVRELQDLSMSMRMVPLRGTFQKMHRVARDLSRKSGKDVELVTDDGETEIDRHMVDILNDVLVHMVRNAIDHGVETPEEREMAGKSPTGTVRLKAFHSGGSVVVEIQDDGRGMNREKIFQKAVKTEIVDADSQLTDNEVFNLIFAPGLSTSEEITDVSGRGVGMDVVRKGIETLHGRIDINTEPGIGSTFTVRLPLTLAITDGMLVRVGSERYIIPTIGIHLCFRPKQDALSTVSGRGELVMLRGDMMPIFRLHNLFEIESAIEDPAQGLLVVVGDENRRCALLVDELLGQQQVVAKSLTKAVGKVPGVSGGAILGDGQVGLILDPNEVAAQARQTHGIYRVQTMNGLPAA